MGASTSPARRWLVAMTAVAAAGALVACDDDTALEPEARATQTVAAPPPAAPPVAACYPLPFDAAVAPTSKVAPVTCDTAHTSETVAVGVIDAVVDGHLLAVDSQRVQSRVATACPKALLNHVGGDEKRLRLSMIRPIWFTPSVEESDQGADWYRCDAVVLAGTSTLAELPPTLEGVLRPARVADRYAMCGTAAPDAKGFERVQCSTKHTWRAIDVVALQEGAYPGAKTVREAGRSQCEDAAADRADDPLSFEWGYEWPTEEQWEMGQTFGRCWARG